MRLVTVVGLQTKANETIQPSFRDLSTDRGTHQSPLQDLKVDQSFVAAKNR